MKKKILLVFGTRPEAIKMAPLILALRRRPDEFVARVCVTAQHRQMLDEVLALFGIRPDHDLNIMQEGQSLYHITSSALCRSEKVLAEEKPDLVLVHGDTTTTFAASLAAFYQKIPVGHVEAGLRSYNKRHPFPEEANRVLTDALCDLYFAPTSTARAALLKENTDPGKIFVTGNTVIDALKAVLAHDRDFLNPQLRQLAGDASFAGRRLILATAHRRENFGRPMENIFRALRDVVRRTRDVTLVYPVHLNPHVQEPARRILGATERLHLLPPLDYADLAGLMQRSYLVVTDSGGIQEEAPSLGKPVLVLREVTERPEAVAAGTVQVIGTGEKTVFNSIVRLLDEPRLYRRMAQAVNPYGDGKAAERTVEAIRFYFGMRRRRPAEFRVDG